MASLKQPTKVKETATTSSAESFETMAEGKETIPSRPLTTDQKLRLLPAFSSPEAASASTTDEEETPPFYQPSASSSVSSLNLPLQESSKSLVQRRSHRLDHSSKDDVPTEDDLDEDWDYSETEWWGWIILIVTWFVFVVVMGSCFGIWSWAWDVGETPYAPPELEDDDTLPITGYYPALIVCTAIMSWVWVVVAWVGMKYFRHAKVV